MRVFNISNDDAFRDDMQFICIMFIMRGTAFEKILRKSNDIMKNIMNLYRQKYKINVTKRAPGSQLDSKTITKRIAACFPAITVGLFHHGIGRSIVDPEVLFPR